MRKRRMKFKPPRPTTPEPDLREIVKRKTRESALTQSFPHILINLFSSANVEFSPSEHPRVIVAGSEKKRLPKHSVILRIAKHAGREHFTASSLPRFFTPHPISTLGLKALMIETKVGNERHVIYSETPAGQDFLKRVIEKAVKARQERKK